MKGDFSKQSFDPKKHYHDVLLQQGRVLLDADWNEQASIATHRTETGTSDIVGAAGAPMQAPGFELVPIPGAGSPPLGLGDLRIGRGRFYVDGIMCENEADVAFANQPDFDGVPLPAVPGVYAFYLDVWLRHITVAEADSIREVALGGPDTTTRAQTVWQVKCFKTPAPLGSPPAPYNCLSALPGEITQVSTGALSARSELDTGTSDPCGLVASGGYKRLENQLYRVEIHTTGERGTATFKWSRDNGSVIARWESQDPIDKNKLVVSTLGKDELLGFKSGDWVELIDDATDLQNRPGILAQLLRAEGGALILDPANIRYPAGVSKVEISNRNPRIRRWDSVGDLKLNTGSNWIALEDGVEVRFETGWYKTGDYWTIPARTAKADVEWPYLVPQPAQGIRHHYAKLALLEYSAPAAGAAGSGWKLLSDCRPVFPAVTELTALFYHSGDGQAAMPGALVPERPAIGVANGEWPVQHARIKFRIIAGNGTFDNGSTEYNTTTASDGLAQCLKWRLGSSGSQQLRATLHDAAGTQVHIPILFTASLNVAENIAYDGGDCQDWPEKRPKNVSEALTALCKRSSSSSGGGCSVTVGEQGEYKTIKEAFDALSDEAAISICLKPQKEPHIFEGMSISGKRLIRISGNGNEVVTKGDIFELSANTVMLEGLQVFTEGPRDRISIVALDSYMSECRFVRNGGDTSNAPYVHVNGAGLAARSKDNPFIGSAAAVNNPVATIHWTNNVFQASAAIAFGDRVRGFFTNNQVSGTIYLQYTDKLLEPSWPVMTASSRKLYEDGLRNNPFVITGNLFHMRGNLLDRVITNSVNPVYPPTGLPPTQIHGFDELFVHDNTFWGQSSSFIANAATLANNHFKNADGVAAYLIAHSAIINGNIQVSPNTRIDTLVDSTRKVMAANLGNVV